ncbi:MAG: hypothetical protein FJZ58_07965, partial [Chlamydiae bacterium]|nr:hypothetical protein [Chlamydiota bacterium]
MNTWFEEAFHFLQEHANEHAAWMISPQQEHLLKTQSTSKTLVVQTPAPAISHRGTLLKSTPMDHPQKPFTPTKSVPKERVPMAPVPVEPVPVEHTITRPVLKEHSLPLEELIPCIQKLFPQFPLRKTPLPHLPPDPFYKKLVQAQVLLFSFHEGKETDFFLQNLAKAISIHFALALVLDVEKWEKEQKEWKHFFQETQVKVIIASNTLYKKHSLLPFLKEIPASSER